MMRMSGFLGRGSRVSVGSQTGQELAKLTGAVSGLLFSGKDDVDDGLAGEEF